MDCKSYADISEDKKLDADLERMLELVMDDEDPFPYPEGIQLPSQPLHNCAMRFTPLTETKPLYLQCPASPLHDEERGVGFTIDISPPESDSESEKLEASTV